ncbi:MAG TPA: hypothetical protein VFR93_01865, partial [Candidatus Limnocylindrales bacterium]|nr:hypothetical protein [Candidatus Limnocylindrales bacterium]
GHGQGAQAVLGRGPAGRLFVSTLRRRPRSVALLRLGYRVAYRALNAYAFFRRPQVRGVMCVVSDGRGRILLVRHTYGDRRAWELPGGWPGGAASVDPVEIADVAWFDPSSPPERLGQGTRAVFDALAPS